MEKIRISSRVNPFFDWDEWRLTTDERDEIKRIVKKTNAPDYDIKDFISLLQGLCMSKKMLLEQPPRSEVRARRKRILADCKAASEHLKQFRRGNIPWYDEIIDPLWGHKPEMKKTCPECNHPFKSSWRERCAQCDPRPPEPHKKEEDLPLQLVNKAEAALGPLEKFINFVEIYHNAENRKIGRKEADNDHFIRKIREIYIEFIGEPTEYENGPFFQVVQLTLEAVGLRFSDPSRAIRQALRNK
ncbi:MAG TPA: hypothetical protein PLE04_04395 [Syntrophales bacterium]|nr:hypothetical protein [Syntrophales bacterium]